MIPMKSVERVLCAIRHQQPDRLPVSLRFCAEKWAELKAYLGMDDAACWSYLGQDVVTVRPVYKKAASNIYYADPTVRVALRNTLLYTGITVPVQMLIGLIIAVALNSSIRGKTVWRAIYYIPVLTSWVVVSYIFKYLFNGGGAPINYIFHDVLHLLPYYVDWLQNGWTAQVPINLLGIWKGIGWNMVMFLAGLQSIPREIYEAAAIDGAGRMQAFTRITVPMLRPIILFVLVMLTIGGFGVGISVQLLTNGGPLNSTQVMITYIYDQGFKYFEFGYGAAIAALMALMMFVVSFVQFKFVRGKVEV
jgi:multiple sugar transport system permease protein